MSGDLVVANTEQRLAKPIASPQEMLAYHETMTTFIKDALKVGKDYGIIKGTKKETLLKPGAERICLGFGCHAKYTLTESEVDHDREVLWRKQKKRYRADRSEYYETTEGHSLGLYRYIYKCEIFKNHDGTKVGEGEGVCSTMESKYIDRPRDTENTVCKMAQKRALVAAVVSAFGLSDRFSAEDMDQDSKPNPPIDKTTKIRATLKDQGVPEKYWGEIVKRMEGKELSELPSMVKEVHQAARGKQPEKKDQSK